MPGPACHHAGQSARYFHANRDTGGRDVDAHADPAGQEGGARGIEDHGEGHQQDARGPNTEVRQPHAADDVPAPARRWRPAGRERRRGRVELVLGADHPGAARGFRAGW